MFTYVLNEGKWIQTEKIYPHDIALILDADDKIIYLWEGPQSSPQMRIDATPFEDKIKEKYSNFQFEKIGETIPPKINKFVNEKIDRSFDTVKKIEREPQFFLFLVFGIASLAALLLSTLFILNPIAWDISPEISGVYNLSQNYYDVWIDNTKISILITMILFLVTLTFACFTQKIYLIASAGFASLVQFGYYRYISLNTYLFDFQSSATPGFYHILKSEVALFSLLGVFGIIVIAIPFIISIKSIFHDTIPISLKAWMEKRKTKRFVMSKYSVIPFKNEFINPKGVRDPRQLMSAEELIELKEKKNHVDIVLKPIE